MRNESTLHPLTVLQVYVVGTPLRQILKYMQAPPAGSSERVLHSRAYADVL